MNRKIWINDLVKNKLANFSVFAFFAVSSVLYAITLCLTVQLTGSVSSLMTVAVTPDYLQMHAGDIDEEKITEFANAQEDARDFQICRFLNIDSGDIYLADCSLSGSTQDNGVCVQSERFDFLIDMNDRIPTLKRGEIGVPVCYMRQYGLNLGDSVTIGNMEFETACFIRDSQMNSMMASSKRFLVCPEDYQTLSDVGEEEYLIEFLLSENANSSVFSAKYSKAGLPQNGPAITKSMVLMVNVLSDGIMIMVILFVSILVLLVALLCIRFIVLTKLGQDKKEIGMLKALGISRREIRKLYFSKYAVIAAASSVTAVCIAMVLSSPLGRQIKELYGNSQNAAVMVCMAVLGCGVVSSITLLSIWRMLKRTEKVSALQALFDISENRKKQRAIKWYLPALLIAAAGAMLMVVPLNIHSTISSPVFVTYMGIGSSEIRIDVRQSEDIAFDAYKLSEKLESDESVSGFVRLDTVSIKALTAGNEEINLLAEYGDHSYYPVSYSEGTAPNGSNQIALSLLNAKELGHSVGDEIRIIRAGKAIPYAVCGIYSDITNGGKTAKIYDPALSSNGSERVMWSIFYVSLTDGQNRESWMAEYQTFGEKTFRVSDIASYVASTFGQTISQIRLAAALSVISSSIILFVVLLLFTRLYVQSDRKDISLKKALGFRWKAVAKAYVGKYAFSVLAGIAVGEALGFLLGESLTGLLLKKLGADAFRFIPDWHSVLVKVPLLVFAVCAAAVCCGIHEVKRIRPEECVTGRE